MSVIILIIITYYLARCAIMQRVEELKLCIISHSSAGDLFNLMRVCQSQLYYTINQINCYNCFLKRRLRLAPRIAQAVKTTDYNCGVPVHEKKVQTWGVYSNKYKLDTIAYHPLDLRLHSYSIFPLRAPAREKTAVKVLAWDLSKETSHDDMESYTLSLIYGNIIFS